MADEENTAVLTIDAGSGSVRAILWDKKGEILGISQREWDYEISDVPGGLDFNCDKGWQSTVQCIREAIATAEIDGRPLQRDEIKAVTSASMREGFVVYDQWGKEIWACPNVDARAQAEAAELLEQGHGEEFYKIAGDWTSLAASARLLWLNKNRPDLWERAAHMTMLGDWVLYKLCGDFTTNPSLGSSSAMFDIKNRTWSEHIAEVLGTEHILPETYETGQVIGPITKPAAQETGLTGTTLVIAGGADNLLGMLGANVVEPDQIGIAGGTYWLTAGVTDKPQLDPQMRLRSLCHAVPKRWIIEGCGFAHGLSTRWLRDAVLRMANPSIEPDEAYAYLSDLAESVPPGSNGVNYFASNIMDTKSWKHPVPSFVGMSPFNAAATGLGAMFRAQMEEATYGARGHVEMIEEVWGHAATEVVFFGGPTNSKVWNQIVADILGVPVRVPKTSECTALGAAIAALVGAGEFSSLAEGAEAMCGESTTYQPNAKAAAAYDELFPAWKRLNYHMLSAADQGMAPYMWVGAGAASPQSQRV